MTRRRAVSFAWLVCVVCLSAVPNLRAAGDFSDHDKKKSDAGAKHWQAEKLKYLTAIQRRYAMPWKWSDENAEPLIPEVRRAISAGAIFIGQPISELEPAFGKDSMHWLDAQQEGLILIHLGRRFKKLDAVDQKKIRAMASDAGSEWFLFAYVDDKGMITDLLLRYGTFNEFNMRGFLSAKLLQPAQTTDKPSVEPPQPATPADKPEPEKPSKAP